jgi:hypothetical protein
LRSWRKKKSLLAVGHLAAGGVPTNCGGKQYLELNGTTLIRIFHWTEVRPGCICAAGSSRLLALISEFLAKVYERLLPSERLINLLSSSSLDFRTDSSAACNSRRFTPIYFLQWGQDNFGSYFRREIISSNFTEQ